MSPSLLIAVAVVYAYVSWDFYADGKKGLALAFFAYAVSNIGFVMEALRK